MVTTYARHAESHPPTPEYRAWAEMRKRCTPGYQKRFPAYAGVSHDDFWKSYDVFLSDMGRKPSPEHSLDRINGVKCYSKYFCRWATRVQQSRNRPGYVKLTIMEAREIRKRYAAGDISQTELGKLYGVSREVIRDIVLNRSWKEEILNERTR